MRNVYPELAVILAGAVEGEHIDKAQAARVRTFLRGWPGVADALDAHLAATAHEDGAIDVDAYSSRAAQVLALFACL